MSSTLPRPFFSSIRCLTVSRCRSRQREDLVESRLLLIGQVPVELVVQLEATDLAQVVALGVEEQVVEQRLRRVEGGRITRAQAPVDLEDRVLLGGLHLVGDQGVAQERADVEAVDEEHLELTNAGLGERSRVILGDLLVALEQHLTGLLVDDVLGADLADELGRPRSAAARRSRL